MQGSGGPSTSLRRLLAAALIVAATGTAAHADTVRLLAAGAAQGVVRRLEPDFSATSGHKLDAVYDTVGALRDRVLAGEAADVVLLSEAGIGALSGAGKTDARTTVD